MSAMKFLQGPLAFISSHVGHDEDDRGLKVLPTAETASAKGGFQTGQVPSQDVQKVDSRPRSPKVASTGMALSDLTRNGFSCYANGRLECLPSLSVIGLLHAWLRKVMLAGKWKFSYHLTHPRGT